MEQVRVQRRRRLLAAGALGASIVLLVVLAISALRDGPDPEVALNEFLAAFAAGEYDAAAARTTGDPEQVAAALEANVNGLDGASLTGSVESVERDGDTARAVVNYRWEVPALGEFSYRNGRVRLERDDDAWLVRWRETVIHPQLRKGERLGTTKEAAERGRILDRDGRPIVEPRTVIEVGVIPAELDDRDSAVEAIVQATDANERALRRAIRAAEPTNFVPAITVRPEDLGSARASLAEIPGVELGERTMPLAPTREFARALLGTVGPVTAEQLEELEGYSVGDLTGQGGLQEAHEESLAGTPLRKVVIRRKDGAPVKTLLERGGEPGADLETTLSIDAQNAAEEALAGVRGKAALVAIEPSTGDVLAVANRPVNDGFNRAFEGQYPPGSTFKIVSTAALLEAGLDPQETVPCPATTDAGGRSFRNFEGSAAGNVPFAADFAESCNTAFVSLADRLGPRGLAKASRRYGLGAEYELGVAAFSGDVPRSGDDTEQAAAMIGQARILASPLAMAGVAAAVAEGRWRAPRILASDPGGEGPELDSGEVETLRELMRRVVTAGTGTALAGVSGEPIGKSGTAEYGTGDPPPTHAWFVAARGDLAVAVLVEDRPSGSEHAAPIVAEFLKALDP